MKKLLIIALSLVSLNAFASANCTTTCDGDQCFTNCVDVNL